MLIRSHSPLVLLAALAQTAPLPAAAQGPGALPGTVVSAGFQAPDLARRVLFDAPGDGALWARGGASYKARFDDEGVTYYPRFGPEAPRNYPVSLRLAEVSLGGVELGFERGVGGQRDGETVRYERGSLVELYELRPDSLEQLFRFERLPGGGELRVRVTIETELSAFAAAAGLELANEHGRVGYSRAVALDAAGARQELSTTLLDGAIEIRVPAAFVERAVFPLTIDPVISTFDVSSDAADASNPDVAFDQTSDRYAVCWEEAFSSTDHDVYCTLWTSSGALVPSSEVIIDLTTDAWSNPAIANHQHQDQFLVVAQTRAGDVSTQRIEGRTRQAGSNASGIQFLISGANDAGFSILPDVGGDPTDYVNTYYCVVWQRNRSTTETDIRYQIVRSDGTLLHASTQNIDNTSGTLDVFPSISKSCGREPGLSENWAVVWQRRASTTNEDVYGAQVNRIGQIVVNTFPIDTGPANDTKPQVSTILNGGPDPREYMVVYQRGPTWARDIHARVMRGASPLTPSVNLSAMESVELSEDQIHPTVDSDGNCFAVAYSESRNDSTENYDTYISTYEFRVGTAELVLNERHKSLGLSTDGEFDARITSTQSATSEILSPARRFMAVWQDLDFPGTGDGDIEGALYDAVSFVGVPFCFGDGLEIGSVGCPCDNPSGPGEGCRNSTGSGATLIGAGTSRVGAGDLVLRATNVLPGQPGLFFQGEVPLNGGHGVYFGDGLRCCGVNVIRLEVGFPGASGMCQTTVDIEQEGAPGLGDTKCYQFWYRNPVGGPCGSTFNLTNGYEVTWVF